MPPKPTTRAAAARTTAADKGKAPAGDDGANPIPSPTFAPADLVDRPTRYPDAPSVHTWHSSATSHRRRTRYARPGNQRPGLTLDLDGRHSPPNDPGPNPPAPVGVFTPDQVRLVVEEVLASLRGTGPARPTEQRAETISSGSRRPRSPARTTRGSRRSSSSPAREERTVWDRLGRRNAGGRPEARARRAPPQHGDNREGPTLPGPPPLPRGADPANLLARIDRLERERTHRGRDERRRPVERDWSENPPFTDAIMQAALPRGFKFTPTDFYDGTADPTEHTDTFKATMLLASAPDAIKCRAFVSTLRGIARTWFTELPPASIRSFNDLCTTFQAHFCSNKKMAMTAGDLLEIKQKYGETLRSYLTRFKACALQIKGLNPATAQTCFMSGLRPGPLQDSLDKADPESYDHLLAKVEKYISSETRKLNRGEGPSGSKRAGGTHPDDGPKKQRQEHFGRGEFVRRDTHPLAVSMAEVLAAVENEAYVRWPRKMARTASARDRTTYCRFHRGHGHDTEKCVHLRDEIERLIQRGHLSRFLGQPARQEDGATPARDYNDHPPLRQRRDGQGEGAQDERPRQEHAERQQPRLEAHPVPEAEATPEDRLARGRQLQIEARPVPGPAPIYTFHGGMGAGGESSTGRKRYARQTTEPGGTISEKPREPRPTITFGDEDLEHITLPHDDALVIAAHVGGIEVHRILVDNGSSTEILFLETFKKMNLPLSQLVPARGAVVGLSGDPITPQGYISLNFTVGQGALVQSRYLNFVVLDLPSAYNLILGRTGLHALEAVVSTLHLTMKFPAPGGIGVVRGSQKTARTCYVSTLRGPGAEEVLSLSAPDLQGAHLLAPTL